MDKLHALMLFWSLRLKIWMPYMIALKGQVVSKGTDYCATDHGALVDDLRTNS